MNLKSMTVVALVMFAACAPAAVAISQKGNGASAPDASPAPSSPPGPRNAAEFDQMFQDFNNWHRWGTDDQLGAANLVTAAKRREAAGLVRRGVSVSLAHSPLKEIAEDNPSPFEHLVDTGTYPTDIYRVNYHGVAHSHIDALCHALYNNRAYNGYPRAIVTADRGCTKLGIEHLRTGVITRGILIDMPRLRGVPYLEPGTPVFVQDIENWEKKVGVRVTPGDAIFLRTGRWLRREKVGPWPVNRTASGFHASVGPWIKRRGAAFVGGEEVQDVIPSLVDGVALPLHVFLIAGLGINLLDNQDLETLADTAARLNRWEFMVTIAPMPVMGGTGSPVNALATF